MSARNMTIKPMEIHTSCLVNRDDGPLDVYVALYTAAMPMSEMINTRNTIPHGRLSNRLWLNIFQILLNDFFRYWSGRAPAVSAVLHEHGHRNLRVIDRRVCNEPRV